MTRLLKRTNPLEVAFLQPPNRTTTSGTLIYRMGQFDGSINGYDESLKYASSDLRSQGFFNRGNAAFQMQQYLQAVDGIQGGAADESR